jgi:hypothetical protein
MAWEPNWKLDAILIILGVAYSVANILFVLTYSVTLD